MSKRAIIGLDVGGTKTFAVLFDDKCVVIDKRRFKTEPASGDRVFEKRLSRAIAELVETARARNKKVVATGIGCSGSVDCDSTELRISPQIPFLKNFDLAQKMHKWTKSPAYLGNDVQMGLYGEQQLGAARGFQHVIGVFIGTGIGGALILDGKLHRGANGIAGDIGHYLVQPLGTLGGNERQGVLDNVASRTAIAAEAVVYASRQWAPNLLKAAGTDLSEIRSKTLARAIKAGDKQIEKLVLSRSRLLGIVLSNLVDFLNPDGVLLGGGLVEEMPNLVLKGVIAGIEEYSSPAAFKKLKIVKTKLKEYAVATGAAKMAWESFIAENKDSNPGSKR
jgi:glucokinase